MNLIKLLLCTTQPIKYSVVNNSTRHLLLTHHSFNLLSDTFFKKMELANAILSNSEIDEGNPMNISFLQDLMTPNLTPQAEFDTFCRVIINAFHQHITLPLGSIVTDAATPNNEVLSLVWEQANITTQFWHLLSNVQRIKSSLPANNNNTSHTSSITVQQSNNGR